MQWRRSERNVIQNWWPLNYSLVNSNWINRYYWLLQAVFRSGVYKVFWKSTNHLKFLVAKRVTRGDLQILGTATVAWATWSPGLCTPDFDVFLILNVIISTRGATNQLQTRLNFDTTLIPLCRCTNVVIRFYKVVQIWPGLIVCKQVTVCPGHIWTTLYYVNIRTVRSQVFTESVKTSAFLYLCRLRTDHP